MFYKIETNRLIIRCYRPTDALLFKKCIDESIDHLKPFMPWAKYEPQSLAQKEERLYIFSDDFDYNRDYTFGIFDKDESKLIGSCGLHKRVGDRAFEIGYWININEINKGFAIETTAALSKAAFDYLDIDKIFLFHLVENYASEKIPLKLNFISIDERQVPAERLADLQKQGKHKNWLLTKEMYAQSSFKETFIKVFDIFGTKM